LPSNYNGKNYAIYDYAFISNAGINTFINYSNITSVIIPNSVTSIGESAFARCTSLESVTFENTTGWTAGDTALSSSDLSVGSTAKDYLVTTYVDYTWTCTIPDDSEILTFELNSDSTAYTVTDLTDTSVTSITIPSTYQGLPVTTIGARAFKGVTSLTSVTIPDSVTSIEQNAFYNCSSLTSVTLPSNITSISTSTFYGCTALTNIKIPSNVTKIGNAAFSYCQNLTSIIIPENVTTIGESAFEFCIALKNISLPTTVTSIGAFAFYHCTNLQSVTIGSEVTTIGASAFNYCTSLESVTIPASVTTLNAYVFSNCTSLTTVTFENTTGWTAGDTALSSSDLSVGSTAKDYLVTTYVDKTWTRGT
jgi:hypothetical protein